MIKAVVVDDEPLARNELTFLLGECGNVEVVGEAPNAARAIEMCEKLKPDLAFVDLRMPGPDGIVLAQALRARQEDLAIIVVSAHDEGALRAFDANVSDYLLKPVRLDRLRLAVERIVPRGAVKSTEDGPLTRLAVRRKGAFIVVDVNDVIYFHVKDELVWAVTADDRFSLDLTLAAIERRVASDQFFRSHRSALVRLDKIRAIEPAGSSFELMLDHPDSPRVSLARDRVKSLRSRIPIAG